MTKYRSFAELGKSYRKPKLDPDGPPKSHVRIPCALCHRSVDWLDAVPVVTKVWSGYTHAEGTCPNARH